jgi:AcrR family transcriptional regulator
MDLATQAALKPRKKPRQARAEATVEAILQATVQVLLSDGGPRLTTTRVAERAGVSVGTLYQYFSHKQALLYAALEGRLEGVAVAVETACASLRGQSAAAIVEGVVAAYVAAKTADADASRALYRVAAELDAAELVAGTKRRVRGAVQAALVSANDLAFDEPSLVVSTMLAAIAGVVRSAFESGVKPAAWRAVRAELTKLCRGYVLAAARQF